MDIIRYKNIFLSLSGLLVLLSILAVTFWGLKLGIDFTGGSLLEVEFSGRRPPIDEIKKSLEAMDLGTAVLQPTGERGVIMRFRHIDDTTHQAIIANLQAPGDSSSKMGETSDMKSKETASVREKRFDTIGPTIGAELKRRALWALMLAVVAIILYIAWAFRHVSQPVASWKYGIVAVIALIHDVTIPTGVFAGLGHFRNVEIDSFFITALLTILGFSVHDTIVVFDRIRENLRNRKMTGDFGAVVNRSVNETLTRSINTSLTVLIVLAAIFFWGGATTQYFSLALILGITFGTYSSIFLASPLLVIWSGFAKKKNIH